jgi:hypothetical protein
MNRSIVLVLSAVVLLGACGDHGSASKAPTVAAASTPEMLPAQPAPPAVESPPVALPPLPSVNQTDADAPSAAERPTPVETAVDSAATNPKGTLTQGKEANSMPMAAHGNNHSSPSLESSSSPSSDHTPQK